MMPRTVPAILRTAAIAIAVAALIDPVFGVSRLRSAPLVLIDMTTGDALEVVQRLRQIAPQGVERSPLRDRLPCEPGERCVIVADGSRGAHVPEDLGVPISLVTIERKKTPNLALESAIASASQHAGTAGAVRVVLNGQGVAARRAVVRVVDAGAVIGSAMVELKADGSQAVEIAWWPIADGARVLRVEAALDGGDAVAFDNAIDLPVTIASRRIPVLVFEARPSWSSTFVRRALEDDPRFLVEHRGRVTPGLTAGTAGARLDAAALDAIGLVVVGAPDALTAADVDLLDRYVRIRGGSVILLPERAPAGAVARLFPGEWTEQLVGEAETSGLLRATELLRPRDMPFGAAAISPLVVATPVGRGQIVISGAMDAWRHRDDHQFDRFWTSLAAESAALGEQMRIEFDDALTMPGTRVPFVVRYRATRLPDTFGAAAIARCGGAAPSGGADQVRLLPTGATGEFSGVLPIGNAASCSIEATINGVVALSSVAVAEQRARGAALTVAALEQAARRSGGIVTDGDNLEPIRALNNESHGTRVNTPVHPMRSVLWLLPFAGCLAAEWWLRRRNGLR